MTSLYAQVPKGFAENLEYRLKIRTVAAKDVGFQRAMIEACRQDFLFFVNVFGWLYEPRPRKANGRKLPNVIPFITWPHQDAAFLQIREALGYEDIGAEKARGEGMSWALTYFAIQDWAFEPMSAIGLVSRSEAAVDTPDDMDSLFAKIDWIITKLPVWMVGTKDVDYRRSINDHTLKNIRNGSMISGFAATGEFATGGRKKWIGWDELAKFPRGPDAEAMTSSQQVTDSRLIISTPKGTEGEYHRVMHEASSMVKVVLDWKDNPTRNRGLYTLKNGIPVAVDPINNPLLSSYEVNGVVFDYATPNKALNDLLSRLRHKGFKLDDKIRSPWYDHECDRAGATPQSIAQELDRDYGGSMFRIYGNEFFAKAESTKREPRLRGLLNFNLETLEPEFDIVDNGPFLMWTALDHRGNPPMHPYAAGVDLSAGLGGSHSSNSVIEIIDMLTMEQVLEYATNTESPTDFADICIALCKLFNNAYLAWEANHSNGGAFTKRVKDRQYGNVYYRKQLHKRGNIRTTEMGWWSDDRTIGAMHGDLNLAVRKEELTLRGRALIEECGQYVNDGGKIVHVSSKGRKTDGVEKGKAHGDRVVAMCVALQAAKDRPMSEESRKDGESYGDDPPYGTMAYREKVYRDSLKEDEDPWKDFDNSDIAGGRSGRTLDLNSWN